MSHEVTKNDKVWQIYKTLPILTSLFEYMTDFKIDATRSKSLEQKIWHKADKSYWESAIKIDTCFIGFILNQNFW